MIHDYAVQPEELFSPNGLWQRHADLGVASGRIIADFPNMNWLQDAQTQLDVNYHAMGTRAQRTLDEWLCNLHKKGTLRRRPDFVPPSESSDWVTTVGRENRARPFRAIICNDEQLFPGCNNVIRKLDVDLGHERWKARKNVPVRRVVDSVAAVMHPLAAMSQDLLFVEPYFALRTGACGAIAKIIAQAQNNTYPLRYVEVHTECKDSQTLKSAQNNIEDHFPRLLQIYGVKREKWRLIVKFRSYLHDRCLLTEIGGISLSAGFDHAQKKADQKADLMDEDFWLEQQCEYNESEMYYRKFDSNLQKKLCGVVTDSLDVEF